MSEEKTYTQTELDATVNAARIEERFISYIVLSSAKIPLERQPAQYRDARAIVENIVKKSKKYDDLTKERFSMVLAVIDNCGNISGDNLKNAVEGYNQIVNDLIAQPKVLKEPESEE